MIGLCHGCYHSNVELVLVNDLPTCISCKEEDAANKRKMENGK